MSMSFTSLLGYSYNADPLDHCPSAGGHTAYLAEVEPSSEA